MKKVPVQFIHACEEVNRDYQLYYNWGVTNYIIIGVKRLYLCVR